MSAGGRFGRRAVEPFPRRVAFGYVLRARCRREVRPPRHGCAHALRHSIRADGAVTAKVVAASIPAAWELAAPVTVTRLRYEIVSAAVPRVLGAQLAQSPELARGAEMLRGAAEAIPNANGRPLYAGHAELDWPCQPDVHGPSF